MDSKSRATIAAMEGISALDRGDTEAAGDLYRQAGEILLEDARAASNRDKSLLLFLAATQFYLGGHYDVASEIVRRISPENLASHHQVIWDRFVHDVRDRSAPDYRDRLSSAMMALESDGKYSQALRMACDHPYVFRAADRAAFRASCLSRMGESGSAEFWRAQAEKLRLRLEK